MQKQKPLRDKAFRKWISELPCLRCKVTGHTQAAHIKKKGHAVMGGKVCDTQCRPLCTVSGNACHEGLDGYKDDFWTDEKIQEALDMPLYEYFKRGASDFAFAAVVMFR